MKVHSFTWSFFTTLIAAQTVHFEAQEATVASVHAALFGGQNTCRDIVSAFIARIEAYNPYINAIITLNPTALHDADRHDLALGAGNATGSLFCVPILLKDNFDAKGMPTTAGAIALKDCMPQEDSPSVSAFRGAGAVILGKTNLHEFGLEGLSVSSLGGQTVNPYDFTRTPGGSSGGTGAAVAASFAVLGIGNPASANNLYSFRPTYGLISRAGVVPISWVQDTAGAIGRSLSDIAIALTVMAGIGHDLHDNATAKVPSYVRGEDYATALASASILPIYRIGILRGFFDRDSRQEADPVRTLMMSAISTLAQAGAQITYLEDASIYEATVLQTTLSVDHYEYCEVLSAYLSSPNLRGNHPRTASELYSANRNISNYLVVPSQYHYIQNALRSSTSEPSYASRLRNIESLTEFLHGVFSSHNLDAIIYPEQSNLVAPIGSHSQYGRNGVLAALTGSPVITVPIGFSNATETAPIGVPVGMEILGMPWTETKLLSIAKLLDDKLQARRAPVTGGMNESVKVTRSYDSVPLITPSGISNIDLTAYPLGSIGLL